MEFLLLSFVEANSSPMVRIMVTGQDITWRDCQLQLLLLHLSKYPGGMEDLLEFSFQIKSLLWIKLFIFVLNWILSDKPGVA